MKSILSERFSLQGRDFIKGLIVAALTAALVVVQTSLSSGNLVFKWEEIGMAAVAGGVGYLIKNFAIEPPKVITTTSTNVEAKKAQAEIQDTL